MHLHRLETRHVLILSFLNSPFIARHQDTSLGQLSTHLLQWHFHNCHVLGPRNYTFRQTLNRETLLIELLFAHYFYFLLLIFVCCRLRESYASTAFFEAARIVHHYIIGLLCLRLWYGCSAAFFIYCGGC